MIKINWLPPSTKIRRGKDKQGRPYAYKKFYVYDFKWKFIGEFDRTGVCKYFSKEIDSLWRFINKTERINGFYYLRTEKI